MVHLQFEYSVRLEPQNRDSLVQVNHDGEDFFFQPFGFLRIIRDTIESF